ncbi:MAG: hypothetical protein KF687_12080 [Cyclobacteriaceae bacterium]|nr:hypothetical protein [Cyclobacteriaceae bacterium]
MPATKFSVVVLCFLLIFTTTVRTAQAQEDESKFGLSVSLNSDIFFGFYPFFAGSYKLNEKAEFTFYGILWSGGTGAAWGNWTEFGGGINFLVSEGLNINPQIGLLNGSLTSGLGTPVLGEGIVPNLTIGADYSKFEGEIYFGYYLGLDHGNPNTNNFIHYWINGGTKLSSFFSAGLHFEHLRFAGGKDHASDAAYNYYASVGPYIQFANPNGKSFARFTTGWDLRSDEEVAKSGYEQPSFFKLSVGFSL